jgi:hypothetical protein
VHCVVWERTAAEAPAVVTQGYLPPQHYDQIFCAHGTIMIFFVAMPNLVESYSGFKNYDPVWTYTYRGYYDPSLYTYIGRYGQIGATYRF